MLDLNSTERAHVDRLWADVVAHCTSQSSDGLRIMGPAELASALNLAYDYTNSPDVERIDALIVHKDCFGDIDAKLVKQVLRSMTMHFANEVFLVFARGEAEAPIDARHIGALAEIEQWIGEGGYRDGTSEALTISAGPRMAGTYVGDGRVLLQNTFGQLMLVAGADTSIVPHLLRDGWFDLDLTHFLLRSLHAGQVFVDVGANFGTYSLLAAAIVGPAGRVVSVEANQSIAEMLNENMVMNGFGDRSTVAREAAGAATSIETMFQFSIRQGGSTMLPAVAELAKASYAERIEQIKVPCRSLDDIVEEAGLDRIDYIKIDVEGFEASVFKGAVSCIKAFRPRLIVEWHPSFLAEGGGRELYDTLTHKLGYVLRVIGSAGATRRVDFDELAALSHADILAVPKL